MLTEPAEKAISGISDKKVENYKTYWESVTPKTDEDKYWRWVFAFLSVHASWESNVRSFKLLRKNRDDWRESVNELTRLIRVSGVGLHTRRVKGIWEFSTAFFADPKFWQKKEDETWIQCRDRIQAKCYGLGLAKTAFALEMCYPNENKSVCLDTHMLQLYGFTKEADKARATQPKRYKAMEEHWAAKTEERDVPSYIARCLFWDQKQNQENSRYWSSVLEDEGTGNHKPSVEALAPSIQGNSNG